MTQLFRRTLLLIALSAGGIALLAPLAARSASAVPLDVTDALLPIAEAPAIAADRGNLLSGRAATPGRALQADTEQLSVTALPTPGTAPMEATLQAVATPKPTPAPTPRPVVAAAPAAPLVVDGSVWDRLAQCESGGNWSINTGNGYYGGLQFSYGTWHGYGGGEFAEYPHQATREEQIIVAERLHAARGFQPWPACRVKLGLP